MDKWTNNDLQNTTQINRVKQHKPLKTGIIYNKHYELIMSKEELNIHTQASTQGFGIMIEKVTIRKEIIMIKGDEFRNTDDELRIKN